MGLKFKPGDLVYDRFDARRHDAEFTVRPILLLEYHIDGPGANGYDGPWWRVLYEEEILDWNSAYIDNRCERLC